MSQPTKLRVISYLAPNWFWFYEAILTYLGRVLGIETQFHQSKYDPLADPILLTDQLDLAFICGLPLVRSSPVVTLQPVVAPVMEAPRYQNRPIYFTDVIVHAESHLFSFADLAGKTFCYNDPGSNSGYNLIRHRLLQGGHPKNFFAQTIQSGFHQRSIRWVVEGLADCAGIDSVVLEQELRESPDLSHYLRVVEVIGPCPMPPLVANQHLDKLLTQQIQAALLHPDAELQTAMKQVGVRRFAAVDLSEYEAIATIYNTAIKAGYEAIS
ncbi:PhnD/SsuA/transferrin family substrate-binding protein [Nostoc sp. FACHB-152]|uniref:PhnD/SsuA/transferrin family substrate-binding protein n=1 Tax=unclassified Nostoc TaxID=2593658 RepID=UPI001683B4EF|nr:MULTISPECIES: PhnD/SsuA/transferrin family substrate-binding protein [unclassified Nostoc]MBD2446228.1 PhnD/SsuA/transferrin family substrate-binding protein [Nostoc sp. FACHB-152]MBD2469498.1 PhnD/SsuA/transferrin family substrate-binding protein [Nostoc sp. FACHB-145]